MATKFGGLAMHPPVNNPLKGILYTCKGKQKSKRCEPKLEDFGGYHNKVFQSCLNHYTDFFNTFDVAQILRHKKQ